MLGNVVQASAAQGNLCAEQWWAALTWDWVKSFNIDWILDCSILLPAQPYSLTSCGIFQWHIALHFVSLASVHCCISQGACTPRINHFPASLLHEMKEFIMVTVGCCKAFAVIYLREIDWFINTSEQDFSEGAVSCTLWWRNTSVGIPCSNTERLPCFQLTSLPRQCSQWPTAGSGHFVTKNRAFLISSSICLPT